MTLILVAGLLAAQAVSFLMHLLDRAALMSAGHMHPGLPGFDALPLRFLWHVGLTVGAVTAVALIAVRWATRPLDRLADAATAFAQNLDAPPLDPVGPTEVRRAAEAFNFMQQRLRQLVQERSRALAAVSHDLRTPLTRMRLRAELVEDAALQAKLNGDIDAMQAMVDGVLAYLRGLEDAEPLQAINMEALLGSIVEDAQALGRNVSVSADERSGTPALPFAGRLSLLRRAVTNLVDNAIAHGQQVAVRLMDSEQELRIVVEDDGPGIPDVDLARATEPYVRLDPSRSLETGGVGLGLAIARDAAACHGGRLVLENRSSGGLRATIVLPHLRKR
jgi:signal transduction histidine kinase